MSREELADAIEDLDRRMVACADADSERKMQTQLAELIEGRNLRMICAALRERP